MPKRCLTPDGGPRPITWRATHVECALKSCIARQTNQYDFPDKDRAARSFSHNIENLVDVAGLIDARRLAVASNHAMGQNWSIVRLWTEASRYVEATEPEARSLFEAVTNPSDRVLPWIMAHW
jgi:hypothetical protein